MSNEQLIIAERSRDIGNFLVGRLLPFRKKRMVGPFIFIDHMGPSSYGPDKYMDIDQHPHIGLSTLTYLFEGEIEHRDSIGTKQIIRPGDVNWMTAGRGVTHTERTPEAIRTSGKHGQLHGYQIWVALPKEKEDISPAFQHLEKARLQTWEEDGLHFSLIAGEAFGKRSELSVHSPMFLLDLRSAKAQELCLDGQLNGEVGICVVRGSVMSADQTVGEGELLVSKAEDQCSLWVNEDSHLLIFGGEGFPEERHIDWNFVSSSKEKLITAREDWKAKRFPLVEGDESYIPHPKDS